MNAAVIVAAGEGRRLGGPVPKQFQKVCGQPLISYSLAAFAAARTIDVILLVLDKEWLTFCETELLLAGGYNKPVSITQGGKSRQESVRLGLEELSQATPHLVAVHDAARPLITPEHIDGIVSSCDDRCDGVVPAVRIADTIKRSGRGDMVAETISRENVLAAQTPQVFRFDKLLQAHEKARDLGWEVTDDSQLIETIGGAVRLVPGESTNIKVTLASDILLAKALLRERSLCEQD